MKKESKWPKRGRKDMWKRESQDRVETVESEKGKMSNEQGERVTHNQFTKRKKER